MKRLMLAAVVTLAGSLLVSACGSSGSCNGPDFKCEGDNLMECVGGTYELHKDCTTILYGYCFTGTSECTVSNGHEACCLTL